MKESYEIMGLPESATDEELEARYKELKAKYDEEKWQDGEAGTKAARALNRLETAYEEIKEERSEAKKDTASISDALAKVGDAIRAGDLNRAQQLLDDCNERNAEWHYLQSVVFYKKNWMNESKKQLEIAIRMDENNEKYRDAYVKLNARADYRGETGGAPKEAAADPAMDDEQMGGGVCANCASMCSTCLCVNCLYNLCCGCR